MWKLPQSGDKLSHIFIAIPPIFPLSITFASGIYSARFLPFQFFQIAIMTFAILIFLGSSIKNLRFFPVGLCAFFLLGVLFGSGEKITSNQDIALSTPEGRIVLEGVVISAPESIVKGRKETISFILDAQNFFREGRAYQTKGKVQVFLHNPGRPVQFGDSLRLRGMLEVPNKPRNPHSFDYASYLGQRGISRMFRGIGRFCIVRQSQGNIFQIGLAVDRFRTFLKGRLEQLYPSPYRELAVALIFGFRKNIDRKIQDDFIKTGTAHLIAISGMNISLVGGLFYLALAFFRFPRALNLGLTALFIGIYALLAGSNSPVLRAAIMGAVVLIGFLLGQDRNLKSALFFSFFILLAFDPRVLFQASFQLSFIAMASLIFILPPLEQLAHVFKVKNGDSLSSFLPVERVPAFRVRAWLSRMNDSIIQTFLASLAATIGMFPVLVWYFNLFSMIGFLANIVTIPLCTAAIASSLVVLVVDLICAPLAHWLAFFPLALFRFELWLTDGFAKVPFGYFYLPRPSSLFFGSYYLLLMAWLFLSHRKILSFLRSFCLAAFVISLCFFLIGSKRISSQYVFFDLGKTEAAFISFSNGSTCLINTGRSFPGDQAYWTLRPYLMASGVRKLDGILFTEMDGMHAGGFRTLSRFISLRHLWIGEGADRSSAWKKYIAPAQSKRLDVRSISKNMRVQFGSGQNVYIDFLVVSRGIVSAVRVVDGSSKALYLTDVTSKTFESLLGRDDLSCDLIFLPHHEFQVSESEKVFLKRLAPNFLILNQRDNFEELRAQFEFLPRTKVIFIGESGSVTLRPGKDKRNWTYQTFVSPETGKNQLGGSPSVSY